MAKETMNRIRGHQPGEALWQSAALGLKRTLPLPETLQKTLKGQDMEPLRLVQSSACYMIRFQTLGTLSLRTRKNRTSDRLLKTCVAHVEDMWQTPLFADAGAETRHLCMHFSRCGARPAMKWLAIDATVWRCGTQSLKASMIVRMLYGSRCTAKPFMHSACCTQSALPSQPLMPLYISLRML